MMKIYFSTIRSTCFAILFALGIVIFGPIGPAVAAPAAGSVSLTVAAAASLKDALTTIGKNYTKLHPEVSLHFNFGSSGTLQTQIEQGAPVDIFASAADSNMDALAKGKLIDVSTRRNIARNTLVLIVPSDGKTAIHRFKDLGASSVKNVAIGGPDVPAGKRAQEVFTSLGIWPTILQKAVRCTDVRGVLTQVELGNVDAGIVYATDAEISHKVRVIAVAPASMHKPIRYPIAVVTATRVPVTAKAFAAYLSGAPARAVLKGYGFLPG